MSEEKLLPCPMCGGKDIKTGSSGYSFGIDNYIKCNFCGAKIQMFEKYGMEELVKRWNTRKPMEDIVERLEEHKSYNQMMLKKFPKMGTIENAIYKTQRDTYENAIEIVKGGVED